MFASLTHPKWVHLGWATREILSFNMSRHSKFSQLRRCANAQLVRTEMLYVAGRAGGAEEVVAAFGVMTSKDLQRGTVECAGVPFAFDGVHFTAAAREHEIDFSAGL